MAKFSDDVVRKAIAGRGEVRKYEMPGAGGIMVGVRVPSDSDLDGARLRAVDYCKKRKVDPKFDPDFLENAIQRETIALALVDSDQADESFFQDADEVASLDPQMCAALYEVYLMHFMAMDPYAFASADEVKELEDTLGKSDRPEAKLSVYDLRTLRVLLLSMALSRREKPP